VGWRAASAAALDELRCVDRNENIPPAHAPAGLASKLLRAGTTGFRVDDSEPEAMTVIKVDVTLDGGMFRVYRPAPRKESRP